MHRITERALSKPIALVNNARLSFLAWGTSETLSVTNEYSFDGGLTYPVKCSAVLHGNHIGRDGNVIAPSLNLNQIGATHVRVTLDSPSVLATRVLVNEEIQ